MTEHAPTRAVYTALIGSYERLQEQPAAETTDIPFICLTDDPTLTSKTWEVRLVEPAFARDSARASRFVKIMGDPLVADYDETLWVDNKVVLTEDPGVILDELLADADLAVIHHSYRDTVIAEFDEVTRAGLDDPARIYEQLIHYAETKPHVLDLRPYWGAFIARRRTPAVQGAMQIWINHVLRYSRRDQLSMRYALDGVPRVLALDLDNFGSRFHTWVVDQDVIERDTSKRTNAFRTSIRAPLAGEAALTAEVASLRSQLDAETARTRAAQARVTDLRARVARLRTRVERLRTKLDRERARSAALAEQLARSRARRALDAVRRVVGGNRKAR
jgi:hypothetical protein